MARYSMKELKDKLNSGGIGNLRQLDVKSGGSKKIWLPMDDVFYKRTHFDIKTRSKWRNSSKNILECLNQTPGEKGAGCPICEEIEELWKTWRDTNDKEEKKKITARINNIVSEEFWYNGIDLDNPTEFVVIRFTPAMFREIEKIADKYGIQNVTWIYKYTKDSNRYTLIENTDNKARIDEMRLTLDEMVGRDYENGGQCDLEKALFHPISKERMLEILNGNGSDDEEEHVEDYKPKAKVEKKKDESKPKAKMVEETSSLEELSLEDVESSTKKDESKPKDKLDEQLTLEDEKLGSEDIGDLGLEDLDLEDKPKLIKITFDTISEKVAKKDAAYLKKLAAHLVEEKKIEKKDAINDQIREVAAYVKKSGGIEVPENVIK